MQQIFTPILLYLVAEKQLKDNLQLFSSVFALQALLLLFEFPVHLIRQFSDLPEIYLLFATSFIFLSPLTCNWRLACAYRRNLL